MKKLTSMLLALALVLSLAACGGAASSSVASSAASSEAVPEAASEAASSEEAKKLSTTDALRIAGLKGPTTMGDELDAQLQGKPSYPNPESADAKGGHVKKPASFLTRRQN